MNDAKKDSKKGSKKAAGGTAGGDVARGPWSDADREGVAFAALTLAPLFLHEPGDGEAANVVRALAELDVEGAAAAWPFIDDDQSALARDALVLMNAGARDSLAGEALAETYRRLFVGPARLAAPPWGSVYTDRDCVAFGLSMLDLRAWMREHGVVMKLEESVPEDHIGLLLEQAGFLAQEKPMLLDELFAKHILTWSSHYLDQLADAALQKNGPSLRPLPELEGADATAGGFYAGLARITKLTLEGVRRVRGLEVVYPRYFR